MTAATRTPNALSMLTDQQLKAAATIEPRSNIEAAPGSGKTTVAALRFGYERYVPTRDVRAVVAVSFTKAATGELRRRVLSLWGPTALNWPNRVVTLDGILRDLLEQLLQVDLLYWPNNHKTLRVIDTWVGEAKHTFTKKQPVLVVVNHQVQHRVQYLDAEQRVDGTEYWEAIYGGTCTHDDVRRVLGFALSEPTIRTLAQERISRAWRSLIVDEVYDANRLDLYFVLIAAEVGTRVTLIGDPWQALYLFRNASPDLVPEVVDEGGFKTFELDDSFRFKSEQMVQVSNDLRDGRGITLPSAVGDVDIAIGTRWTELWKLAAATTLPISFGSPDSIPKAAANLLLNQLTRARLGRSAIYIPESLRALGMDDDEHRRIQPILLKILTELGSNPGAELTASSQIVSDAWSALRDAIIDLSGTSFPGNHGSQRTRLQRTRARLIEPSGRLILAVTVHQAKGQEWDSVQLVLTATQTAKLASGLRKDLESDRELYVAATRARWSLSH